LFQLNGILATIAGALLLIASAAVTASVPFIMVGVALGVSGLGIFALGRQRGISYELDAVEHGLYQSIPVPAR
jgi:hypothetical protein